jgi:protein MAK11
MVAKRKRENVEQAGAVKSRKAKVQEPERPQSKETAITTKTPQAQENGKIQDAPKENTSVWSSETTTVQVVTGSYERVLHGFTAAIPRSLVTGPDADSKDEAKPVEFSDTFLFNAHASAIRCLALSPPTEDPNGKILLATGSTDERINVYSLSLCPPAVAKNKPKLPSLHGTSITENSRNKELGSLLHHASSITALHFPSRSKLLSSSEDSTIAITRTRDWEPLSTIKAPIPKPQGRPSGDTAGPGEVPSGVNDFAVHPSNKLMLSVGKGEKCMRLWNLVTGKKAGVLSFSREILSAVGEGRFGSGEGRRVVWDSEGEEFAVGFERGAVVFGIDCKVKANIVPSPRTKIHQMHYLPGTTILVVSTEDGRIMFYNTSLPDTSKPQSEEKKKGEDYAPPCTLIAQLGGPAAGIAGRVKDFEIIPTPSGFLIIAGSSDGSVRLWGVPSSDLEHQETTSSEKVQSGFTAKQVGKLIGTYSTGTRITCLKAFVMTGKAEEAKDEPEDEQNEKDDSSSDEEASE